MILIAHRGNIDGQSELENTQPHIIRALNHGFDIEVDVRLHKGKLYFGHDHATKPVPTWMCRTPGIWWHAKTIQTLHYLINQELHTFLHDTDDCALTSNGYIWVYPGRDLVEDCIAVIKNVIYSPEELKMCHGICSDNVIKLREELK